MKDFLNPKSMLTPGAAGALIMFLVNGLCFTFPELAPRYVALALSFVIGGLAVSGGTIKPLERGVYWFLNSLIIFCMGMGTANLASSAAGAPKAPVDKQAQVSGGWFIASAAADTSTVARSTTVKPKVKPLAKPKQPTASEVKSMQVLQAQLLEQQKMIEALRQQNLKMQQKQVPSTAPAVVPPPAKTPQKQRFFKSW